MGSDDIKIATKAAIIRHRELKMVKMLFADDNMKMIGEVTLSEAIMRNMVKDWLDSEKENKSGV